MTVSDRSPTLGEHLALAVVGRFGERGAKAGDVRREIERCTERPASVSGVYATLYRLEDAGLVASDLGPSRARKGGRRRRYYRLREAGRAELEQSLRGILRIHGIPEAWPAPRTEPEAPESARVCGVRSGYGPGTAR